MRSTLELDTRALAGGAIEDLLVHHLRVVQNGGSFLYLPAARASAQAAWQLLLRLQHESIAFPGVPGPGERPLSVAKRLVECLGSLDWDASVLELWRARLERIDNGQSPGESAFRAGLKMSESEVGCSRLGPEWRMGLAECLLDRGAVREATTLVTKGVAPRTRASQVRLRRLQGWLTLLTARGPKVEGSCSPEDWALVIPKALIEMREDWPAASTRLAGRGVKTLGMVGGRACLESLAGLQAEGARRLWGAVAYGVFAVLPGGGVATIHREVAPGLRRELVLWMDEREPACSVRGRAEHALLVNARAVRRHGPDLPSALSSRALALTLIPILDQEDEVVGWVHLEWEHHLIPSRERMAAVADVWRPRIRQHASQPSDALGDRVREVPPGSWSALGDVERLGTRLPEPSRSMCVSIFEQCMEALGLKLAQRRWWGFVQTKRELRFVASGGDGLAQEVEPPGGGRGLDRCLSSSGVVQFDSPQLKLSIHGASASGVVLPLIQGGALVALIVIESSRRKDFKPMEVNRLAGLVHRFALPLSLAMLRAWHAECFGSDLFFNGENRDLHAWSEQMQAASRSRSPVVFCGPSGAGKRMWARWLHWSRGHGGQPMHSFHAEQDFPPGVTPKDFIMRLQRPHGSVVLDDLLRLRFDLQGELLACLEAEDGLGGRAVNDTPQLRERLICLIPQSLEACVAEGSLREDLAARLGRLQIFVPGLSDRRQDIPGLVQFLCERLANEERSRPPSISDEALALLWRQKWRGNLRELEAQIFKLVLLYPGERVGPEELQRVAQRFRFPLLARLPSKRPRREDLVQALRTTLKKTGRINKRRAALYLGWDPDTLVLRLGEMKLDEQTLPMER